MTRASLELMLLASFLFFLVGAISTVLFGDLELTVSLMRRFGIVLRKNDSGGFCDLGMILKSLGGARAGPPHSQSEHGIPPLTSPKAPEF